MEVMNIPGEKDSSHKKKAKIRKEAIVIGFILLLMLLTLWGWYLKTNHIEVFEAGGTQEKRELQANLAKSLGNHKSTRVVSEKVPSEQSKYIAPQNSDFPLKEGNSLPEASLKININTAGIEELVTLNGIGEVKAQEIVAYREQNGAFERIEQLLNVKGIGEATFNKIQDWITVEKD